MANLEQKIKLAKLLKKLGDDSSPEYTIIEGLAKELDDLRSKIPEQVDLSSLDETVTTIQADQQSLDDSISALSDKLIEIAKQSTEPASDIEEDTQTKKEISDINDEIKALRNRFNNLGGGNMNRQIRVEGVDVLTKYTDINLYGATSSVLATVDNTNHRVNIKIPAGTGDVVGPSSSTDNAVVRFDGTTGKLIQNSTVTVSDTGNIAIAGGTSYQITADSFLTITPESSFNLYAENSTARGPHLGLGYLSYGWIMRYAGSATLATDPSGLFGQDSNADGVTGGPIIITTGVARQNADSGSLTMGTGDVLGNGNTGNSTLTTGNVGGTGSSGDVIIGVGFGTSFGKIKLINPSNGLFAILQPSSIATTSKTFTFPNTSGTFALTSDLGSYIAKDGSTTTTASIPFAQGLSVAANKHLYLGASAWDIYTDASSKHAFIGGNFANSGDLKIFAQNDDGANNAGSVYIYGGSTTGDSFNGTVIIGTTAPTAPGFTIPAVGTLGVQGNLMVTGSSYFYNTLFVGAVPTLSGGGSYGATIMLNGQSARTFALERNSTAATAGNILTIKSGGAVLAGTNLAGGDLQLAAGTATGSGVANVVIQATGGGGSGTADKAATTVATFGITTLTLVDSYNIAVNTSTGTKIGTATTQKLGFFNATPVAQQANSISLETVLSNLGFRASGSAAPITVGTFSSTSTTDSSSTITGGGKFSGGVGIAKTVHIGGNLSLDTVGNGLLIKTGSNAKMGTGTLSSGTVTINTTAVKSTSFVFLTDTGGSNIGSLSVGTVVDSTSFVVNSSNVLDSSTFNWIIIDPS